LQGSARCAARRKTLAAPQEERDLSIQGNTCYMLSFSMITLGIDPGTRNLGWGVVNRHGNKLCHIAHGVVRLNGNLSLAERLTHIETELDQVLHTHHPEVGSVETLFFHKDAQAAAKLGHARGVVLLALARAGVEVAQYSPAKVKRTVAGGGRAEKRQVALMIQAVLGLQELPKADAADALALAVTHLRLGEPMRRLEQIKDGRGRRRR
jgi:crossover junction endodeoxyribonuclease RuvC